MAQLTIILLIASMALVLLRALKGPTAPDRILAANAFSSNAMAVIATLAVTATGRVSFLDVALVYALVNAVGTIAALKCFACNGLSDASEPPLKDQPPCS